MADDAYLHAARSAALFGTPFESLSSWATRTIAEKESAKVVSFADYRRNLRPPEPRGLMAVLQNIDAIRDA